MKKNQSKKHQSKKNDISHSPNKNSGTGRKLINRKKRWFYLILILIPVLFLLVLEFCLRTFNYGYNNSQWLDAGDGRFIINPELGKKYFNNVKFVPLTGEDTFAQVKKENSFRIFVLGESTAAGYPYMPLGSFSRYIRKRLELVYPGANIEVINIGMTGISSYVIRDLLPGVLEQKPDLILIYAGHNEYYGALGVGSVESAGSPFFIKSILALNNLKLTQLLRNGINLGTSLFSSGSQEVHTGTLMSRMAKDQYISLDSDNYKAGLMQFEENLTDILELTSEKKIPVIIGNLVSNLKDQKPFVSVNSKKNKPAGKVYDEALKQLKLNNIPKADSLFKLAKDLDALRFRAPSKFNIIIKEVASKFHTLTVPLDSIFALESPDGITGNNLMTDHLHPNLKGYQLMGKAFYEVMTSSGNLPKISLSNIPYNKQDSLTRANFVFTELDSIIGNNTVTLLKNDWPFVAKGRTVGYVKLFHLKNLSDSLALECIEKKLSWPDAHIKAAIEYLKRDEIPKHLEHMNALIYQYPTLKNYNSALRYFYETNKINPADFTVRRIGIIHVYNQNYDDAIKLLNESLHSNPQDAEVHYFLTKAYLYQNQYKKALDAINISLKIKPQYPEAIVLKQKIELLM